LGFAVHRPAHRSVSPRRHGTPCRDVLGRVHIRMIEMFADATAKNRLALTILRIAMPTSITGLGCVRGLDLFYAARSLFLQPGHRPAPSGRMDGAVESGLGPDVPPRKLSSAASRTNQIPDLQVLDADDIESAGQIGGNRFDPILTQQALFFGHAQARCHQKIASRQGGRHLAPRRPAARPGEEIRHRLGEVPERLLPHGLGTGCQPREFSSGFCQLAGLLGISGRARPARPPMSLLFHREIPDKSSMCTVLQQRLVMGGRRLKAKPHMSTLSTVTDKRRRERRFPPTPEVGVSTPRIP
jgi:hypothetical protein